MTSYVRMIVLLPCNNIDILLHSIANVSGWKNPVVYALSCITTNSIMVPIASIDFTEVAHAQEDDAELQQLTALNPSLHIFQRSSSIYYG